mgnify:CR=1 FL=1
MKTTRMLITMITAMVMTIVLTAQVTQAKQYNENKVQYEQHQALSVSGAQESLCIQVLSHYDLDQTIYATVPEPVSFQSPAKTIPEYAGRWGNYRYLDGADNSLPEVQRT